MGDFKYNARRIQSCLRTAKKYGTDVLLFPELTITGYPPEDLLLKERFIQKNVETVNQVVPHTAGITAVIGYAEPTSKGLYNSAALVSNGKWIGSYRKMLLPNYGVFDEKRYFKEGTVPVRFTQNGVTLGMTVCEDIWDAEGPGKALCLQGNVDVLLNISSSPYFKGKGESRKIMIQNRARHYQSYIVYANLVGGQDELVFDGQSLVVAPDGSLIRRGNAFAEELIFVDLEVSPKSRTGPSGKRRAGGIKSYHAKTAPLPAGPGKKQKPLPRHEVRRLGEVEEIYRALELGTRDYILKNGFKTVVIGLSGGVDSSLTAAIARDALGPENVVGVLMPSPYTSRESMADSHTLAANLGIQTFTLPIESAMKAYESILSEVFEGTAPDVTEENLQARIRGNLLMALSNKFGWLVLTTGNKSELSVGYCTLYGDMAGGFAVIKDVPKTWVYDLARWVNQREGCPMIPENILTREPSAELRPDQRDTDSLPPYSRLDAVLTRYIEDDCSLEELWGLGLPRREIRRVARMVDTNEYKRRQGPPGIKITPKAFGKDRRLPITNHYKG